MLLNLYMYAYTQTSFRNFGILPLYFQQLYDSRYNISKLWILNEVSNLALMLPLLDSDSYTCTHIQRQVTEISNLALCGCWIQVSMLE